MENYEQHNEVSTSFNNNSLKHNYNECKNDFYFTEDKHKEANPYMDKNYRFKLEDGNINPNVTTPFSVKDILNINHPNYYERSDIWKCNERERRHYEYDPVHHQAQGYCPPEYFGQVYPNIPMHSNLEYWNQEVYHDHKIDEYYNYNQYQYCHNLYHQNYDQYAEVPPPYQPIEHKQDVEREIVNVGVSPTAEPKKNIIEKKNEYIISDGLEKDVISRKSNSKYCNHFMFSLKTVRYFLRLIRSRILSYPHFTKTNTAFIKTLPYRVLWNLLPSFDLYDEKNTSFISCDMLHLRKKSVCITIV